MPRQSEGSAGEDVLPCTRGQLEVNIHVWRPLQSLHEEAERLLHHAPLERAQSDDGPGGHESQVSSDRAGLQTLSSHLSQRNETSTSLGETSAHCPGAQDDSKLETQTTEPRLIILKNLSNLKN